MLRYLLRNISTCRKLQRCGSFHFEIHQLKTTEWGLVLLNYKSVKTTLTKFCSGKILQIPVESSKRLRLLIGALFASISIPISAVPELWTKLVTDLRLVYMFGRFALAYSLDVSNEISDDERVENKFSFHFPMWLILWLHNKRLLRHSSWCQVLFSREIWGVSDKHFRT